MEDDTIPGALTFGWRQGVGALVYHFVFHVGSEPLEGHCWLAVECAILCDNFSVGVNPARRLVLIGNSCHGRCNKEL